MLFYGIIGVIIFITLITVGPWFTILALNTLFQLAIPFNFWTWLSMLWIQMLLVGATRSDSKE
jgi:hypothetical protein